MRAYLVEQLGIEETPGDRRGRAARPGRTCGSSTSVDGHRELRDAPWTPGHAARRSPTPTTARPTCSPPCARGDLLVHHPYDSFAASVERFIQQAVADPDVLAIKMTVYRTSDDSALVPSLIRGGRARQAGRLPGRAEGALRRAPEHRVGALAGRGGRARGARPARPEDARQGAAGGAPRGLGRAPLRAHRDRQLPRQDRAPVRGLRPVHDRPRHRRRRGGAVQHADRRRPLARASARWSRRPRTCATGSSTRSSARSRRTRRARRRASC